MSRRPNLPPSLHLYEPLFRDITKHHIPCLGLPSKTNDAAVEIVRAMLELPITVTAHNPVDQRKAELLAAFLMHNYKTRPA